MIALRKRSPVLRQPAFFEGRPVAGGDGCKDLAWFHPAGRELSDEDWFDTGLRSIGMYLDGRGLRHRGARGQVIIDDSYLLILHSGDAAVEFTMPGLPWATSYEVVVDTTEPDGDDGSASAIDGATAITVEARSVLLLRVERDCDPRASDACSVPHRVRGCRLSAVQRVTQPARRELSTWGAGRGRGRATSSRSPSGPVSARLASIGCFGSTRTV